MGEVGDFWVTTVISKFRAAMNPEEEDEDDVMMSLPPQDETSNSNNGSVHAEQTCEEMDFNQGCLHKVELLKKPEQMNNLNGHGIQPEMIQNGEQSKPQVDSVGEDKISVEQNRTTEKGLDCETVALIQAGAGEDKEIALEETEEMAPGQDLAVDPITENNMGEANGSSTEDASTSESQNLVCFLQSSIIFPMDVILCLKQIDHTIPNGLLKIYVLFIY